MELLLLWYSVCLSSRRRDEGSVSAVSAALFAESRETETEKGWDASGIGVCGSSPFDRI